MQLKDLLTPEEIKDYHEEWENFSGKYILENSYHTHSGMPIISKVFQYRDKPLFRAHVFPEKLRKFDPYFITEKYIYPFWHAQHYFIVAEQLYHASSSLIRDNSKLQAKDPLIKIKIREPLFWGKSIHGISTELVLEKLGQDKNYLREIGNLTFYEDRGNKKTAEITLSTFWQPRLYIKLIEKIEQGDKEALNKLIKKIEAQNMKNQKLFQPRQNLPNKDLLIEQLRSGQILEAELHDFFSFWDKTE